jgi:hypothetical protein
MTSCEKAAELVSRSLDGPLGWRERLALGFHLVLCAMCRRFRAQSQLLQRAGQIAGSGADPLTGEGPALPAAARERILRALRGAPPTGHE